MRKLTLYIICLLFSCQLAAQNNTGTPYSNYGLGLIPENLGPFTAMGGVSAAMRDNVNVNFLNPASYTALDSNRFYFQLAMNGEYVRLSSYKEDTKYRVAQNAALSMALRLYKNIYASFGFTERSDIGYDVLYNEYITADDDNRMFSQHIQGEGGLNELYIGLAWRYRQFSIGLNTGYVFGKIEQRQTLTPFIPESYYINSSDRKQIRGVIFTPGIQYQFRLPKESMLTLGGMMNFTTDLNANRDYLAQEVSMANGMGSILKDEHLDHGRIIYPLKYTVGANYNYNRKWDIAGDYTFQQMSKYKEFGDFQDFNEYHKVSLGVAYVPAEMGRKWLQRNKYMLGTYFVRSHLHFVGESINTYAVTLGTHMPFRFRNRELHLGIAVDLGIRGTEKQGLIQEKFAKIRFNFALKEGWFMKAKIN